MPDPRQSKPAPKPPALGIPVAVRAGKPKKPVAPVGAPGPRTYSELQAPAQGLPWPRILLAILLVVVGLALFIGGMEFGYRRASGRYEQVLAALQTKAAEAETAALAAKNDKSPVVATSAASVERSVAAAPPAKKQSPAKSTSTDSPKLVAKAPEKKDTVEKKDVPPTKTPAVQSVSFAIQVQPIFQAKCVACHGSQVKKARLDLQTVASTKKGGIGGPAFEPGSLANSPLWDNIATDAMPPGKMKLTASEKEKVKQWILQGGK